MSTPEGSWSRISASTIFAIRLFRWQWRRGLVLEGTGPSDATPVAIWVLTHR